MFETKEDCFIRHAFLSLKIDPCMEKFPVKPTTKSEEYDQMIPIKLRICQDSYCFKPQHSLYVRCEAVGSPNVTPFETPTKKVRTFRNKKAKTNMYYIKCDLDQKY